MYKIASAAKANRIKTVLDKLLNEDQSGIMAGRFIGESTRTIYDVMQLAEEQNIPGLLLLIDFEKAFDTVSWSFIHKMLTDFNFGPSINHWISTLYKKSSRQVNQGGNFSTPINVKCGCKLGDPISPYIFVLCAKFLAILLRKNQNIKGIKIGNLEFLLTQYADDTTVMLDGSESSLNDTLKELEFFKNISGLNVNFLKTQVIWIGSQRYSQDSIKTKWKLKREVNRFKLLGIQFDTDLSKMI